MKTLLVVLVWRAQIMGLQVSTRDHSQEGWQGPPVLEHRREPAAHRWPLYLGEINDRQERAWRRSIEVLDDAGERQTLSLFADASSAADLCDAQVVIALMVTPEGLPLAYEVLPGNTRGSSTLRGFLDRIEHQYGKAKRTWVMDRGIPNEDVLAQMRASDREGRYLLRTNLTARSVLESRLARSRCLRSTT